MRKLLITSIIASLTLTLAFTSSPSRSFSAPAAPLESYFVGTVTEFSILSSHLVDINPRQTLYRLTIQVISSSGTGGRPDFLKNAAGRELPFYSKTPVSADLFGEKIRAKAHFSGDELGRRYWISDIEIHKQ